MIENFYALIEVVRRPLSDSTSVMSASAAKKLKTINEEPSGVDPEQEYRVLRYLLSVPDVQAALECGKSGDENRGRKLLLATILNLVHNIVNNRAKTTSQQPSDQPPRPSQAAVAGAPPAAEAAFTQIVRVYITNHARLGRKSAFTELLKMLAQTPITFPESVAKQLINIGLSAEEAVRPCSDLLADLITAGAMSPHILMGLIPTFSIADVSVINQKAPDLFVLVVAEVANNAPADRVGPETIVQMARALGTEALPKFARLVSGKFRAWAVDQIARQRNSTPADVERLLASSF